MYITLEIYYIKIKGLALTWIQDEHPIWDIKIQTTINVHYTRFLYVHAHAHVQVHVHSLTLTSHRFFRYGRSAGMESSRWQLGGGVHKLQKEGFHQID